ncbi:MAG: signal peptide peptidase SppA [Pirellulales bacterium]
MSTNNPTPGSSDAPILVPPRREISVGSEPIRVVVEQPGGFSRFLRWLPWVLLGLSLTFNMGLMASYEDYIQTDADVEEHLFSHDAAARDKVAIIDVSGVIICGEGFVKHQIDRVREDENVKAVVLRVDSPGGTITGSHLIYHRLKELCGEKKIPLVVSMGSLAASGGYYVSMAVGANRELGIDEDAKVIFAEPTTTTGSIGVILPHYNVEGLMKEWKIENDSVKSHPLKDMGSITRKMTDEERAKFQAYIDDSFDRFKEVIVDGRPHFKRNRADLDALATGEIFTAKQALANRLVDAEGYLEDAVDAAIELAKLDADDVRVVRYKSPKTLLDVLGGSAEAPATRIDIAALFDLTTPRAYYLYSWFPSIAAAER